MHIFVLEFGEDDPSKCTGRKMVRMGLAKMTDRPLGIVLNPLSQKVLSINDKPLALRSGLTVLDSSWNKSEENFFSKFVRNARRLPILFAGNPINYSKPFKLSSLEAVIGSLYILDEVEYALKLASIIKWGKTFLDMNAELLNDYRGKTELEILQIENNFINQLREEPRQ